MPQTNEVETAERRDALEARDALELASATRGPRTEQHEQDARHYKAREAWRRRGEQLEDEYKAHQAALQRASQAEGGAQTRAGEIEAKLKVLPRVAHDAVDKITEGAAEAFYNGFSRSSWAGSLTQGSIQALPGDLAALHVIAREEDGVGFAERVHACIDRMTADPAHGAPTNADEGELRAALEAARADRESAKAARAEANAQLGEAGRALTNHNLGH